MAEFPFCVDNSSEPGDIRVALRQLRHMVRLGRVAERALKRLKEEGSAPGRVILPSPVKNDWDADRHEIRHRGRVARFPAYRSVSRADMPDYAELDIRSSDAHTATISGFPVMVFEVHPAGKILVYNEKERKLEVEDAKEMGQHKWFAQARVKSGGGVTLDWNGSQIGLVYDQRVNASNNGNLVTPILGSKSPKFKDAQVLFARAYARCAVRCHFAGPDWDLRKSHAPQWMVDLQTELAGWLVEDGKTAEWLERIRDLATVASVMGR